MMIFTGEQLRKVRTFKGIKQAVAAQKLCISQPAYCKLEQLQTIRECRWRELMQALSIEEREWTLLINLNYN